MGWCGSHLAVKDTGKVQRIIKSGAKCRFGNTGTLFFGGPIRQMGASGRWEDVPNDLPYSENSRGIGPSEMAQAMAEGRANMASKEQALHVLAIMEAMMESSEKRCFVPVKY